MNERAVLLCKAQSLVGIITEVPKDARDDGKPAVILLNAGLIHRVGPNRLYVRLARRLAIHGFLSVRFDHSGIGDSLSRTDTMTYAERYVSETQEVMDWLAQRYDVDHFCLIGLCSGASTSFSSACCDTRVVGVVLLNVRGLGGSIEWMRYVENRWQMREFVRKVFTRRGVWKIFTGKVPYLRVAKVAYERFNNLFKRDRDHGAGNLEISHKLKTLIGRNVRLLWVSSEWDSSREYFRLITDSDHKSLRFNELLSFATVTETNHTFDTLSAQEQLLNTIEAWAVRCWAQAHMTQKDS